ncbi:Mycothiol acetyltransferase [Rosistilla carotiformis]|uniref:Mycothiol acetyltransferase n=2 Tax=Rosistilla carotiformis TaxID=2528017 RepID=A0A518JW17_9BACT|nr:Mycothiol acetyltransferase [Rosistilla carotiformis]
MRRHLITSSVAGALKNPDAKTVCLVVEQQDTLQAAAIASALPGGTGVIVGLRVRDDESGNSTSLDRQAIARRLFERLREYLQSLDVCFVQATCDIKEPPTELIAAGMQHLADLQYLSAEAAAMTDTPSPQLTFIDATAISESELEELTRQTYIDTRDCPSMNQYRSAAETLASYRAMPQHDPSAWRIAQLDGVSIGCVLTLPFVDSSALELTYMGIVPSARGHRWGASLVAEAGRIARQRALQTVNLGVDRNNDPAQSVYERFGFTAFFGEAVWGRRIDQDLPPSDTQPES